MKRSGRVHWYVLAALVGLAALGVLLLLGGKSPTAVVGEFMTSLAKGDVDKLTALTYPGKKTPDQIKKEWDFTVHEASQYYRFTWALKNEVIQGETEAVVRLDVRRYIPQNEHSGAYAEHFEIPLTKVDGRWKVRVEGINREMYPFLPR